MVKRKVCMSGDIAAAKQTSLLQAYKRRKYSRSRRLAAPRPSARPLISLITKDPFPREIRRKITWLGDPVYRAPGTTSDSLLIKLNSLYDPDYNNVFGNTQPLYFDQLCSATGPYQKFRVNSWKAKVTIYNLTPDEAGTVAVPLNFAMTQGAVSSTDVDTFTELINQPGVMTELIGPQNTTFAMQSFWMNGSVKDYIPKYTSKDDDYIGDYGTDPAKLIYLAIGVKNANGAGASTLKYYLKVAVEFDITMFARDAIPS